MARLRPAREQLHHQRLLSLRRNARQIITPSQSIYVVERRSDGNSATDYCDVHYHPWLGEVEIPVSSSDTANPIAIESKRHTGGSNYVYSDGHAKWQRFENTRKPFDQHLLFGEHQAF